MSTKDDLIFGGLFLIILILVIIACRMALRG